MNDTVCQSKSNVTGAQPAPTAGGPRPLGVGETIKYSESVLPSPKEMDHPAASADRVTLSVITTCLDEEENVDQLVKRTLATFDRMGIAAELVIVDDGSRDRTWQGIVHWMGNDARVRGVRHDQNLGIEAGWRSGLKASCGALVCLIDADLQNQPEDIARLYHAWTYERAAVIQGTRRPQRPPRTRYLLSKGLNLLLNATFGMSLHDNKSGFLLCRREVFRSLIQHRFSYCYYQCFLAVAAHARGYSIHQVDTLFRPRTCGESFLNHMPIRTIGRVLWEILKARIEFRPPGRVAHVFRPGRRDPVIPIDCPTSKKMGHPGQAATRNSQSAIQC